MREVTYFEPMKFPNGHLFSQADEEGNAVRNFNKTIKDVVSPDNNTYAKYLDVLTAQESQIEEPYILTNTALYSPICYFPQAVCVFVTKILGATVCCKNWKFSGIDFADLFCYSENAFQKNGGFINCIFATITQ